MNSNPAQDRSANRPWPEQRRQRGIRESGGSNSLLAIVISAGPFPLDAALTERAQAAPCRASIDSASDVGTNPTKSDGVAAGPEGEVSGSVVVGLGAAAPDLCGETRETASGAISSPDTVNGNDPTLGHGEGLREKAEPHAAVRSWEALSAPAAPSPSRRSRPPTSARPRVVGRGGSAYSGRRALPGAEASGGDTENTEGGGRITAGLASGRPEPPRRRDAPPGAPGLRGTE